MLDLIGAKVTITVPSAGVLTIDCGGGFNRRHQVSALTANAQISTSNVAPAGYATEGELRIAQDTVGGRQLTFPSTWAPIGESDSQLAQAPLAVTWLSYVSYDGVRFSYVMQELRA